jgi:magnesium chelatase family protein
MATPSGNAPALPVWYHGTNGASAALLSTVLTYSSRVPRIDYEKLADNRLGEKSATVQDRVARARARQQKRFKDTIPTCNAEMTPAEVRDFCAVEEPAQGLLKTSMQQLNLSARAFHRILKLALTIADLENYDTIKAHHLAEALQYRPRRMI